MHVLIRTPQFGTLGRMKAKCSVEEFIQTWNQSDSIAKVAAALGMTRNSVMSRAARLRKAARLQKKECPLKTMRVRETSDARLLRLALRVISPQGFSPKKGVNAKADPADLEAFIRDVAENCPDKDFVTDAGKAGFYFYDIMNVILNVLHTPPWAAKPDDWDLVGMWAKKKQVSRSDACEQLGLKVPKPKPPKS